MRLNELLLETFIDNVNGKGAVPYNQDIDYFGLRVLMKPSIFLALALPLEDPSSVPFLKQHISQGGTIGAPFLYIKFPSEWKVGDLSLPASVADHDGRNRMTAIKELYGDVPVEVHLLPRGGLRGADLQNNPDWIASMQSHLAAQGTSRVVSGQLFVLK